MKRSKVITPRCESTTDSSMYVYIPVHVVQYEANEQKGEIHIIAGKYWGGIREDKWCDELTVSSIESSIEEAHKIICAILGITHWQFLNTSEIEEYNILGVNTIYYTERHADGSSA